MKKTLLLSLFLSLATIMFAQKHVKFSFDRVSVVKGGQELPCFGNITLEINPNKGLITLDCKFNGVPYQGPATMPIVDIDLGESSTVIIECYSADFTNYVEVKRSKKTNKVIAIEIVSDKVKFKFKSPQKVQYYK